MLPIVQRLVSLDCGLDDCGLLAFNLLCHSAAHFTFS